MDNEGLRGCHWRGDSLADVFGRDWLTKATGRETLAVANRRITFELRTLDGAVIGLELTSSALDDSSHRIVLTFCA